MDKQKEIRAGTLRISGIVMSEFFSDFLIGKKRFINKNLKLRNVRKCNDEIFNISPYYDFTFMGDDLPVVSKGCWPLFVIPEKVKKKENHFKLILDPYNNKK